METEETAQRTEPGGNVQEGYHMENLIHKTLWRLTPKKQRLSEAVLAHTIKKAILGSCRWINS